jgi:hypothetical protein
MRILEYKVACWNYLLLSMMLIFLNGALSAQVIIKERVSIVPGRYTGIQIMSDTSSGHTFVFKLSWTNPTWFIGEMCLLATPPCHGDTAIYNVGDTSPISYSFAATRAGRYAFRTLYRNLHTFGSDTTSFFREIDLDGVAVVRDTLSQRFNYTNLPGFVPAGDVAYTYSAGYYSSISLPAEPPTIVHGAYRGMGATPSQDCSSSAIWYPSTQPVTVTIPVGSQYGSFHRICDNSVYSSFSDLAANIAGYQYVADGAMPGANGSQVVIQATAGSIVRRDSFYVTGSGFRLTFTPDTMKYSDTSKIFVAAIDSNGQLVSIPDTTLLSFSIDSVDTYNWGGFIDPSGNFVPSPLQNVSYGNARIGKVLFLSNGLVDTVGGLSPAYVRATTAQRVGIGPIYLGTVTLRYDGLDSADVFPHLPHNRNNSTDKRDTLDLKLYSRWGSSNASAKNIIVKIGPPVLVDSGGHTHGGVRPRSKYQAKNGAVWTNPLDSLQQATDSSGTLVLRYFASEFGGIDLVKALQVWTGIQIGPETHAFKKIRTKVQGLRPLSSNAHFVKVGGTCNHHGPRVDGSYPDCRTPDEDHYGDSLLVSYIPSIADSFASKYPNKSIEVNDMSLKYGGKFDINGTWLADSLNHAEHKLGVNADLPIKFWNGSAEVAMDSVQQGWIQTCAKAVTGVKPLDERTGKNHNPKPGPHFHIRHN